jgi:hypothetical protein
MISKIVSGGQTGVDRAALDFAIAHGIAHGGFCPKGRRSEGGRIPDAYNLTECSSAAYLMRTALNVQHSDGTLIITRGRPEGGTRKTVNFCVERNKPKFTVDLRHKLNPLEFAAWVHQHNVRIHSEFESHHPAMQSVSGALCAPAAGMSAEADLAQAELRADCAEKWLVLIRREIDDHLMPVRCDVYVEQWQTASSASNQHHFKLRM